MLTCCRQGVSVDIFSMVYRSAHPPVHVPELGVADFILSRAESFGDKPAIVEAETGTALTYRQLADLSLRSASGLSALGFGKGDVCAIYSPNVPEYATAFYAVAIAGG